MGFWTFYSNEPVCTQASLVHGVCVCDLTIRIVDGDTSALGVSVVRHGEHTGVAARVLLVLGIHQSQRAVSKRDPEAVQLHVAFPRRRGDAFPRLAVVGEDVGGVFAVGEGPVEEGVVQVRRGIAGDGQISALRSFYFYQRATAKVCVERHNNQR